MKVDIERKVDILVLYIHVKITKLLRVKSIKLQRL